ncbi:tight adherence protein B [Klenkia soli]|uniref:Tight adherence protein B n=1 Tax=Klenkia soli TaxID=1052260 RepID=A0A1H0T0E5_9ACTN|nr:type II secretion system F family protein [Klenkia soli]SDP47444.1 tight adherence protein B [Klenkia soli]
MPAAVWGAVAALALALAVGVGVLLTRPPRVDITRLQVGGEATSTRKPTTADETVAVAERLLRRLDPQSRLGAAIELAGLGIAAADLLVVVAVGSLTGLLLGGVLGGPALAALLLVGVPIGAWGFLSVRAGRRRKAFAEQLDDALQLMASSLRAGLSLLRAIDAVSKDTPAPMSEEFSRVVNEVRVGRDVTEALAEVAERTGSDDFRWLVQAIGVHREVGGNLAEVLDRVGETLRDRAQLFRQARALSAEGRTSGIVLLALPFGVVLLMSLSAPAYLTPLFSTGTGWLLLLVALGLMAVGAFWLRSIVKLRF